MNCEQIQNHPRPVGAIIGIAVGGGLVLLLAVVVGIYCMKKAKNTKAISPR